VDKRIDVLATALAGRLTLEDLSELDLAYAPPYSSANDPVNMAAFVGMNDLDGSSPLITADELAAKFSPATDVILDVRNFGEYPKGHVPEALNIPVDELRNRLSEVPSDKKIYVHCAVGFRGHLAVRILKQHGFLNPFNVTGGYTSMKASGLFSEE
jgi:rhodanese-related sulfurtransferase